MTAFLSALPSHGDFYNRFTLIAQSTWKRPHDMECGEAIPVAEMPEFIKNKFSQITESSLSDKRLVLVQLDFMYKLY